MIEKLFDLVWITCTFAYTTHDDAVPVVERLNSAQHRVKHQPHHYLNVRFLSHSRNVYELFLISREKRAPWTYFSMYPPTLARHRRLIFVRTSPSNITLPIGPNSLMARTNVTMSGQYTFRDTSSTRPFSECAGCTSRGRHMAR